ncbi:hypothetical protein F383_34819 [Gossypium arboreum]|uniref:Uncharacterized protein n=1 Tax=Gossypium arboreum TaxID=29729 RepID=A0A0B0N0T4_GOSAR|nr:hypothetical protein F383_34819 [Gossypium arboreum]
MCCRKGFILDE